MEKIEESEGGSGSNITGDIVTSVTTPSLADQTNSPITPGNSEEDRLKWFFVDVTAILQQLQTSQPQPPAHRKLRHINIEQVLEQVQQLSPEEAVEMCILKVKSWHALAEYCRLQLTLLPSSEDHQIIDSFWFLRWTAMIQLRLYEPVIEEEYRNRFSQRLQVEIFDLKLLRAFIPCLVEKNVNTSLDRLHALLSGADGGSPVSSAQEANSQQGLSQLESNRVKMMMARVLMSVSDYFNAERVLKTMHQFSQNIWALSLLGRMKIQLGNVSKAKLYFDRVEHVIHSSPSSPNASSSLEETAKHDLLMLNRSMMSIGMGDWNSASTILSTLVASNPQNFIAINNMAISMLYIGKLQESISLLESLALTDTFHPTNVSEQVLFNLTTLYELATDTNQESKLAITRNVASHARDGFAWENLKI